MRGNNSNSRRIDTSSLGNSHQWTCCGNSNCDGFTANFSRICQISGECLSSSSISNGNNFCFCLVFGVHRGCGSNFLRGQDSIRNNCSFGHTGGVRIWWWCGGIGFCCQYSIRNNCCGGSHAMIGLTIFVIIFVIFPIIISSG